MNKKATAIFLSLAVAIMPFLGFPGEMKDIFYMVVGVLIAVLVQFSSVAYCSMCEEILERKHEHEDEPLDDEEEAEELEQENDTETMEESDTDEESQDEGGEESEETDMAEPEDESRSAKRPKESADDLVGIFSDDDDKKE